jgi:hypothetical protein
VERATIASIAEEAGVSVPTVSRVLNGRSDVAPATRSRVEAVINQRGYRRRGATSATPSPVIDVVFPELDGAWAVEVMRGVTRVAREEGLMVNLTGSASGNVPGQGWVDAVPARRPRGNLYDSNIQPKPSFNSTLAALGGSTLGSPSPSPSPTITISPTPTSSGGSLTATPVVASSSPFFSEEDVKLANASRLTSLTVSIVVQRTTGVSFSSQYNTVGSGILMSNTSTSSAITYTFTLASGQSLSPGSFTFAAQMSGTGTTHPTSGDTFTVTSSAGSLSGHF